MRDLMKKYILVSFLLGIIFICLYLYKNNNYLVNKEYTKDNITINYPFFNNKKIDNYINNYLLKNIDEKYNNIFIDYDYKKINDTFKVNFYTYSNINNVIKLNTNCVNINLKNNKISNKEIIIPDIYNIITSNKIDKNKPMIAFTFDDGPNYNTAKIVNILAKYNARATFFVLGSRIAENENIIKKMVANNMEIGNHTYSHKLLSRLPASKIKEEIAKTNKLIFSITGTTPSLVRPSYGSFSKKIKKSIKYPLIIWNIDTMDWKYHNSEKIANNILRKAKDGDIILMHDIYSATVNAVDIVVPKLIEKGYQIVTVSELFYYKDITLEKGKVYGYAKK